MNASLGRALVLASFVSVDADAIRLVPPLNVSYLTQCLPYSRHSMTLKMKVIYTYGEESNSSE